MVKYVNVRLGVPSFRTNGLLNKYAMVEIDTEIPKNLVVYNTCRWKEMSIQILAGSSMNKSNYFALSYLPTRLHSRVMVWTNALWFQFPKHQLQQQVENIDDVEMWMHNFLQNATPC